MSIEILSWNFGQFEVHGILWIPFETYFFLFEKDDFKHLDGFSYFKFEICQGEFELGYTNIYTNYKATLFTKNPAYVSRLFGVTSSFVRYVLDHCLNAQNH